MVNRFASESVVRYRFGYSERGRRMEVPAELWAHVLRHCDGFSARGVLANACSGLNACVTSVKVEDRSLCAHVARVPRFSDARGRAVPFCRLRRGAASLTWVYPEQRCGWCCVVLVPGEPLPCSCATCHILENRHIPGHGMLCDPCQRKVDELLASDCDEWESDDEGWGDYDRGRRWG